MSDGGDQAGGSMAERAAGSTPKVWFMLEADRWLVTAALSAVLWLAIVAAGLLHPTPAGELLTAGDPAETLFQALVAATVTAVTLVPFTLLLASVLRIVTVTKRTLSIGPFILRSTDRDADVEWD